MALVRVFLCTYKRPHLLRRALASLLAQKFTDWVCELHNDAPDDDTPRSILEELAAGDSRFVYHSHTSNWGAVATFNHAYAGGSEPYASILEDDNWWEPAFLSTAVSSLEKHPSASLVWSNMHTWQEMAGDRWENTGRPIWSVAPGTPPIVLFEWPEMLQAITAVHSQGAMVFRPQKFSATRVPSSTPLAIIESLRERAARGPMLLVTAPLANFAITLGTARGNDRNLWLQSKLLVAASFFDSTTVEPHILVQVWASLRAARPRDTGMLFFVAIALRSTRLLRSANGTDVAKFLLGCVRHPKAAWRGLRFRSDHSEVWAWLIAQSTRRPAHCTLLTKQLGSVAIS